MSQSAFRSRFTSVRKALGRVFGNPKHRFVQGLPGGRRVGRFSISQPVFPISGQAVRRVMQKARREANIVRRRTGGGAREAIPGQRSGCGGGRAAGACPVFGDRVDRRARGGTGRGVRWSGCAGRRAWWRGGSRGVEKMCSIVPLICRWEKKGGLGARAHGLCNLNYRTCYGHYWTGFL